MKREALLNIMRTIGTLSKEKVSVKFAYALNRNKSIIGPELDAMGAAEKVFQEARVSLCKQYAMKDDKGEPIMKDGRFQGLEKNDLFEKAFAELPEKIAFEKLLQEEITVAFHRVDVKELPKEIAAADLESIEPILTGDLSKL